MEDSTKSNTTKVFIQTLKGNQQVTSTEIANGGQHASRNAVDIEHLNIANELTALGETMQADRVNVTNRNGKDNLAIVDGESASSVLDIESMLAAIHNGNA